MEKKIIDKAYTILEKEINENHVMLLTVSYDSPDGGLYDKQLGPILAVDAVKWVDAFYPEDSDLDGAPDWRDVLHGTNDNVEKTYLPDGSILAEVNDNTWALFNSDGSQRDGYYTRSLGEVTTGAWESGVEIGAHGPAVVISHIGPEGSYVFTPIPYGDPEILVEGNN